MSSIQRSVRGGLLRPMRRLGMAAARRWPWPVPVTLDTRRRMFVDLRSGIGRGLFMTGEFDPLVFGPFTAALRAGDVFLDVGANVGYYSLRALDLVGEAGAVHAFEVDARPLRCLRRTIRAGRIANLHLHEIAVSDTDGTAHLIAREEAGHSSVETVGTGPTVSTTTLDSWRRRGSIPKVAALKIDVEGGELRVLRGAAEMLARDHPLIVCEVVEDNLRDMGGSTAELLDLLKAAGYTTRWLEGVWTPTIAAE